MLHRGCAILCFLALSASAGEVRPRASITSSAHQNLPITTSSRMAREKFESAMKNLEYMRRDQALADLRQSVVADPSFAQAHIMISHLSHDPAEQASARTRAKELALHVSRGERLLITWMAEVQGSNYVPAIAAMNDLLGMYPRDQRLQFLAGRWLVERERYAQAIVLLEKAVALAPNYPASINELGYAYAFSGDFQKGFAQMERYIALEPNQPNPHDSYGELLRLAGKFDEALAQYRLSIQIDPNFGSELGVADTYAVMGNEAAAREEYERAIVFAVDEGDKIEYELQSAITWIRENNPPEANRTLRVVAKHAHTAGLAVWEAEAYLTLALYEPDGKSALKSVGQAEAALSEHQISESDRNDKLARLSYVRAMRAVQGQDLGAGESAVRKLQELSERTRAQTVERCYHAASGAVLEAKGKHDEASEQLQEDEGNPFSMRLLWQIYRSAGQTRKAEEVASKLSRLNVPTLEQALVVPAFRTQLVSEARPQP
jgi:predicted Zn-dependent protease